MTARPFTGLGGSRVADRFELSGECELGFISVRYVATDDRGERCWIQLIDPGLVVAPLGADQVREAVETLGRVNHAGLLRPYAAGIDAALGCAYFVEPPAAGIALSSHLKEHGRLDSRAATTLLSQLAAALAPLHAVGGAHRAISAQCIFVARENGRLVARLAAFGDGVAQPNDAAVELDTDAQLAPEIAEGKAGDARTDVWALAAVLHQTVDASTHDQLAGLLIRCLNDDPEQRPRDGDAFLRALPQAGASNRTDGGVSVDTTVEGDSTLGTFIGDYEILSLIGEGGMGAVYEVRDGAGNTFALKVIRGEGNAPRERRRFLREARAAAELESEHVVRVIGSGVDAKTGAPFMVMELLSGADVAATIKRVGPLEPAVATRITAEACVGLADAHARGLIHRDVKPPNLFLHQIAGRIVTKVCDFGIVKDTGLGQANTVLTRTGALIGSPSYMSPEQAQDSSVVDLRTDVWSLAASLYEMLAGVPPWDGARNIGEVLVLLHTRDVPPIRSIAPWVPESLAAVLHRGLARDRDERYASTTAFREALLPFASPAALSIESVKRAVPGVLRPAPARSGATSTLLKPAASPPRRRLVLPAVLAAMATAALAFAGWRASNRLPVSESPPTIGEATAPVCDLVTCTAQNDGKPSRCRADGACIALETEQCRALADEHALADPKTVWLGSMLPTGDKDVSLAEFGRSSQRAIDLALRDFASVGGLPATDGVPARSLGVIACDDSSNAAAAAHHLVAVGVPAVIGFRSSKDVIQLAQLEFIPNDVLVVPALNSSALISSIPHPSGTSRLVFRTASTSDGTTNALAALLSGSAAVPDGARRLLVLRSEGPVGAAVAEAISTKVRVGGRPVGEIGAAFRELAYDDLGTFSHPAKSVDDVLEFRPNVIVMQGFRSESQVEAFLTPLEQRWPAGASRPTYLLPTSLEGPGFQRWLANDPGVRRRVFGITTRSNTPANLRFTSSYNAVFGERLPPSESPGAPYDSLFLLAYATYASNLPSPRGSDLARAIGKLVPPGKPTDVGVGQILSTFAELDRGGSIDLQGAFSRMDFDLNTGESPADYAILCAKRSPDGKSYEGVDSGLVYDSAQKKLTGTFNCK